MDIQEVGVVVDPDVLHWLRFARAGGGVVGFYRVAHLQAADGLLPAGRGDRRVGAGKLHVSWHLVLLIAKHNCGVAK